MSLKITSFRRRVAPPAFVLGALLLVSVLSPLSAPGAHAMLGECGAPYIQWKDGVTNSYEDPTGGGHMTETGIKGQLIVPQCDIVEAPVPGDGGDTGGGAGTPPPAPPGPKLPAPPASVPAGAAPMCAEGANNHTPGVDSSEGLGSGDIVATNVEQGLNTGNIVPSETTAADRLAFPGVGASRFVSLDVNVGPAQGGTADGNPYEGLTPENAAQALYEPGGSIVWTEVGPKGQVIRVAGAALIKAAGRAIAGVPNGHSEFIKVLMRSDAYSRLVTYQRLTELYHDYARTPGAILLLDLIENLMHDIELYIDLGDTSSAGDAASFYADASTQGIGPDHVVGNPNGGACGHLQSASAVDTSGATLTGGGAHWVHVTLVGTLHGTLVDRLKTAAPTAHCPSVELDAIAGQVTMAAVTSGCTAPIQNVRLLTRSQVADATTPTSALKLDALMVPGSSLTQDIAAQLSVFRRFSVYPTDPGYGVRDSVSALAEGNTSLSMSTDGYGQLYYKPPASVGGGVDGLAAVATDTSGHDHPFIIKVAVKSPPTCSEGAATRFIGSDHTVYIQDGVLELMRAQSFTIDPKTFCETDYRDSYRVIIENGIGGTTAKVNTDGTVTYSWTDPDVVGDHSSITVTAWDEKTGAPSTTVDIPIHVRDVVPVCDDVHIEYDRAAMKGAPVKIPLKCTMTGGLKVLHPLIPQLLLGEDAGARLKVSSGVLTAGTDGVTFTPDSGASASTIAAQAKVWNEDPRGPWNIFNRSSAPFTVAVIVK
ncbi:hypothetical protein B7R21_12835 [Subtercola boreus]|uniref:Bacterial Ig-like domain-containing protein n=1 Tax=Subtercola boreus TaxID=120213 RepID=A0A3E0VNW1_9MICO|nr:hypothetical protein [Subtercola boreus]RFA11576.1 hypothetical protein B7R21_12835 [Subtercola boreus]